MADSLVMSATNCFPASLRIRPKGPVDGTIRLPGSKSLTNRALLCATLADGTSTLSGALVAEDTRVMMRCLQSLGGSFAVDGDSITVIGTGGRLRGPDERIDAGASGTTARFVSAAATLADGPSVIDGTPRMRRRPIGELVAALQALGADVEALGRGGYPPVRVGGGGLAGGHAVIDARRSSQFVSAVALTAPYADRDVSLEFLAGLVVSRPYIESTVEVMHAFGGQIEMTATGLEVHKGGYQASSFPVEPDASAATYPLVAAAITGGSVRVPGLSRASRQADLGILDVLAAMGCRVRWADSEVFLEGPAEGLRGVEVDMGDMPDAVLALAVAGAFASGPTRLTNIANLRIKESDRLAALEAELRKLGADAEAGPDWLVVRSRAVRGARIDTYDDHRMAMAFSLAGLVLPDVVIRDPVCVAKTWPAFFEDMRELWPNGGTWAVQPTRKGELMAGLVVAIDGPGGAGKTTVSRGVANRLSLPHLDTGAFYRAAALAVMRSGVDVDDSEAATRVVRAGDFDYRDGAMQLAGEDVDEAIRSPALSSSASKVSAIPAVREVLVARQQQWVEQHGGAAVVEGRDIGTVVFPEAPVKVFLTARPDVRAARRASEFPGGAGSVEGVAAELERRDRRDSTRAVSPLRPAADAVEVDTSDLSIDEVIARIVQLVSERVPGF
jgi:3-phosphoshikimate 1-carboxyvinyltransferase